MSVDIASQHVVVFAQRFSLAKQPCIQCVTAVSPDVSSPPQVSSSVAPNVSAEVVNINKHFFKGDLDKRKEDFRRKYETNRNFEIDVDVTKLSGSQSSPGTGSTRAGTRRSSTISRKMSQTITFDDSGRVIKEEFVQSGTFSEESSVFDEDEDPLGCFDFTNSYGFGQATPFEEDINNKSCQTCLTSENCSVVTQTISFTKSDFGAQADVASQNDLNKIPNILVTPPLEKQINIESQQGPKLSKQDSGNTQDPLKNLINNLHSKLADNKTPDGQNSIANTFIKNIGNLHSSLFNDSDNNLNKKTSNLKNMFESNNQNSRETGKSSKMKHELRKVSSIAPKLCEDTLLDKLTAEIAKLPNYMLVEFQKSFIKTLTDRELLAIVKERFQDNKDEQLIFVIKDLCKNILVDDMYDILEDFVNNRPYNECTKISMKMCENFLNKKDMTEFIMRNYGTLTENDKKVLTTSLLEDLPYESLKSVLELQIPKLKNKDIPHVLNNIKTLPNTRELERAVCILSSRLSAEEVRKVIKELIRGMNKEEVVATVEQLLDDLPEKDSEGLALKYVKTNKVCVEKWTETKSVVEVKKMVSKVTGTDPIREVVQTTEKKKLVHVQGESWIGKGKKFVNRSCQTDAVHRLLFKDKHDLQSSQEAMNKAKKRVQDKLNTVNNSRSNSINKDNVIPGRSISNPGLKENDSSASATASTAASTRTNLLDEIEMLKQEKQNIYYDYQEYFNIALDQEEEVGSLGEELERAKRVLSDNLEELHYLKEERDNANEDIKDLEDELADSKIMIYDLKSRPSSVLTTGRDGKKINVANADRLSKELEKLQGLDEELTLLQEDFLEMEQKWLAEQKRKKYYEEMALSEERKAREMSQQLYMIMTNELTPATFKERVMSQDPSALDDLPKLTGSQLNALLTLFVAAGALPESQVPNNSEIYTLEQLQQSGQYTPDQVGNLLTSGSVNFYAGNDASHSTGGVIECTGESDGGQQGAGVGSQQRVTLAPGLVYTDKPELVETAGTELTIVQMPNSVPEGMSLISNKLLNLVQEPNDSAPSSQPPDNHHVPGAIPTTTPPPPSAAPQAPRLPGAPPILPIMSGQNAVSSLASPSAAPYSILMAPSALPAVPFTAPPAPRLPNAPPLPASPAPPLPASPAPPAPQRVAPTAPPLLAPPAPSLSNPQLLAQAPPAPMLPNAPQIIGAPSMLSNAPSISMAPSALMLPNAPQIIGASPMLSNAPPILMAPSAPMPPNASPIIGAPPIAMAPPAPRPPNAPPIFAAPPAPRPPNAPPIFAAPSAPRPPNAPPISAAPSAPRPPNSLLIPAAPQVQIPPNIVSAPPAPRPLNAPLICAAPPAPRPSNAPPIVAPPALKPSNTPQSPSANTSTMGPPVVDSRLLAGPAAPGDAAAPPSGSFVPRGRLEDLKNRKGRKVRNNTVVKKKTLAFGPTKPLKVFNWAKLPEAKAANSIWKDINEVDMITMLNLDEIDELFQSKKSVKKEGFGDGKKKVVHIIDAKRAQNLTILLSKFKKTNEQLMEIVMKCDQDNEMAVDMWEQLLKYVPTKDEGLLLAEVREDPDAVASMNRADLYFLSAVSIYHYEERIKSVNFRKKFDERVRNINPKIRALIKASTEVVKSDKLKDMLTLILGFGNYFNFGKRGNAMGFKLETLTKIGDTRSSDNQTTLLIYLTETVDLIFPELDSFMDDLANVPKAAKVALAELKADVSEIQSGYRLLIKECEHMAKTPNLKGGSTFTEVFSGFLEDIKDTVTELEQSMGDMKKKYTIATSHFAEASSIEPETFFGYFNTFILQYLDGKEALMKKRDEEDKRKKKKLSVSTVSSPTPRSRPLSPGTFSIPNSPIPEDLIQDLIPSLEALEQKDHDLMMSDLFSSTTDTGETVRGPGSTSRRRKKRRETTSVSEIKSITTIRER